MLIDHPEKAKRIAPARLAHFVIRTKNFDEQVNWYTTVFQADTVFRNDAIAFLSFDEEHHRIAIANLPDLDDPNQQASAIDHVAFSFESLSDLLSNYKRLKDVGVLPVHALNHGPTTSLYYADPDGNKIELQVDNFSTSKEAQAYFFSDEFARNMIGVPFDADELLRKFADGVDEATLLRPGSESH